MALLLDNDVVEKLAQLDLLTETKELLIFKFGQLIILDTLKYKLCPRKESKRKKRNATVMSRIEDFIKEDISEISCPIEDDILINALSTNPEGLDEGEMQLLQALFKSENELLFTGDKRFLKALANANILQEKLLQVKESFICFEQIICFLIANLGFEYIKNKYIQALESEIKVDTTFRMCFEGRDLAVKERVLENFGIQINYIHQNSPHLLSSHEEWQAHNQN